MDGQRVPRGITASVPWRVAFVQLRTQLVVERPPERTLHARRRGRGGGARAGWVASECHVAVHERVRLQLAI